MKNKQKKKIEISWKDTADEYIQKYNEYRDRIPSLLSVVILLTVLVTLDVAIVIWALLTL